MNLNVQQVWHEKCRLVRGEQVNVVSCFHPAERLCGPDSGRVRGVGGGSNTRTLSHSALGYVTFFFFPSLFSHMLPSVLRRATRTHLAERTFESVRFLFLRCLMFYGLNVKGVFEVNQMQQNSLISLYFHANRKQRLKWSFLCTCPSPIFDIFTLTDNFLTFSQFERLLTVILMETW